MKYPTRRLIRRIPPFTRNQALEELKRALKPNGIRIDLATIFGENGSWKKLLALYFVMFEKEGSKKMYFLYRPNFGELVQDADLLKGFRLLLPDPPEVVYVSLEEDSTGGKNLPGVKGMPPTQYEVFLRVWSGPQLPTAIGVTSIP